MIRRRQFIHSAAAFSGATLLLPFAARADDKTGDVFMAGAGKLTVHPVAHASFVLETVNGVIYSDPVGAPELYADLPKPDLILVTHEHGDHYNAETLTAIVQDSTAIIANPAVFAVLPEALQSRAGQLANGESTDWNGMSVDAIPAYNITQDRLKFHPQGRDNGYVLGLDGFRIYISGDTENVPEMKALENIDLAFVCMNLPFTMDIAQAADGVGAFKPKFVYPYHYRGRDGGTQDPAKFAELLEAGTEVRYADWYGKPA